MRNKALWMSMALVPAFFACRDRDRTNANTNTAQNPTRPDYMANQGTTATDQTGAGQTGAGRSGAGQGSGTLHTGAAAATDENTVGLAKISSRGTSNFTGTAKIHDVRDNVAQIDFMLTDTTPGTYTVYIFDTSDCSKLPMIDVESGAPALGDDNSANKVDQLAKAGDVTVDADGKGSLKGTVTASNGTFKNVSTFNNKAIGLYSQKPSPDSTKLKGTTTAKGPEACGIIVTARPTETAG